MLLRLGYFILGALLATAIVPLSDNTELGSIIP